MNEYFHSIATLNGIGTEYTIYAHDVPSPFFLYVSSGPVERKVGEFATYREALFAASDAIVEEMREEGIENV